MKRKIILASGLVLFLGVISVLGINDPKDAKKPSQAEDINLLLNSAFTKTTLPGIPDNWQSAKLPIFIPEWPQGWELAEAHAVPNTRSIKVISLKKKAGMGVKYVAPVVKYAAPVFPVGTAYTFSVYLKSDDVMPVSMDVIGQCKEVTSGKKWKRYICYIPEGRNAGIKIEALGKGCLWINAPQLEKGSNVSEFVTSLRDVETKKETKRMDPKKNLKDKVYPKFWRVDYQSENVWTAKGECHGEEWSLKTRGIGRKQFSNADVPAPFNKKTTNYLFSCYIKADRVKSANIMLAALGARKEWIKELSLDKNITTCGSHDWRKFEISISNDKFPPGTAYLAFWCFHDDEGTVWWDDFSLTASDQPETNLVPNPGFEEHHEIMEESPDYVFLDRSFYTNEEKAYLIVRKLAQPYRRSEIKVCFMKNNGEEIERKTASVTKSKTKIPLDIANLPLGDYVLNVNIISGSTNANQKLSLRKIKDMANGVKADRENRCLLIQNKPFIPMSFGVENITVIQAENPFIWKDVAKHGFNTVTFLAVTTNTAAITSIVDRIHENGLRTIHWVDPDNRLSLAEVRSFYQRHVLQFKEHPSLLAWYFKDEPGDYVWHINGKSEKDLAILHDDIKNLDTYHPVFLNQCSFWIRGYGGYGGLGATDIFSQDYYPIMAAMKNLELSSVLAHWSIELDDMAYDGKRCGKPAHQWMQLTFKSFPREVTVMENRCQTYLALIHGTMAMSYFLGKPMSVELWDSFIDLNKEIVALTPILAGGEEMPDHAVQSSSPNIHFLAKKHAGKTYLICANISESPMTVDFSLSPDFFKRDGTAEILFAKKRLNYSDYTIKDKYKGLETRVYELQDISWFFRIFKDLTHKML